MKSGGEELSPPGAGTFAYIGEAPMAERVIILRDYLYLDVWLFFLFLFLYQFDYSILSSY